MVQSVKNSDIKSVSESTCPFCKTKILTNLGEHIKNEHGDDSYKSAVLKAKEEGIPDPRIGELFNINFKQLERIITEAYGINITSLKKPKKVKHWVPKEFKLETTTVWSYRRRGDWATHDSRYRANWSPYIPRNIILRYSNPGNIVLDYFVGGGTTAIEAKLLGRKCIARDINTAAVGLTRSNLRFKPPPTDYPIYEPKVSVGNAKHLRGIAKESIDLICAHPPYAGIISFGSKVKEDLSRLNYDEFIDQMRQVAAKSYSVLKPGGKCVILIGDARKKKHVIPIGFSTIGVFLDAEFQLKELIIKRQHNCKTTGFWYTSSIRNNFLLLAHEYLAVFEKPDSSVSTNREEQSHSNLVAFPMRKPPLKEKLNTLETTSVWILPSNNYEECLTRNVVERYSNSTDYLDISVSTGYQSQLPLDVDITEKVGLLFIKSPCLDNNPSNMETNLYIDKIKSIVERSIPSVNKDGFLVIQTRDLRVDGYIEALAKKLADTLVFDNIWLKEIIIVTKNDDNSSAVNKNISKGDLNITHQYLLVYEVLT